MDRLHRRGPDPRRLLGASSTAAGFEAVEIQETHRVHEHAASAIIRARVPTSMTQAEIQLIDPQTLYRRWEDSQWNPFEIDLERDKEQWAELDEDDRDLIYWVLAQLMVAEERITTKFSGLVGAYGDESEATFLSTQQVDEARHMQFYARFQDEVVDSPATVTAHVERARQEVTPAFRKLFDEALVEAHEQLVAAPRDLAAKVRFVTIYHLILESTLGLTTFRFATEYLEREELLPGLRRGLLAHPPRRDPPHRLRRLVPARERPRSARGRRGHPRDAARSAPLGRRGPGGAGDGSGPDIERLGVSTDEVSEFALAGLTRRLDIIGVPLADLLG